jgi:sugar lactone lactonase YvrE
MEYAPFGLGDTAWTADVNGGVRPVWIIRNGLNDTVQNADTDFAAYDSTATPGAGVANANGAVSVGVVVAGGVAAQGAGLYEDANPWPVLSFAVPAAGNLATALAALNVPASAYGSYTVKLGAQPTVPAYPATIVQGGTSTAANNYKNTKNTHLAIEGVGGVVDFYREKWVWTLLDGNTVSYGAGVHITPMMVVSTLAGSSGGFVDNDNPLLAKFASPQGVVLDGDGNVYVADRANHRIRKLTKANNYAVSTLAGTGVSGFADNADPLLAQFYQPVGIAVDGDGNLYVTDQLNRRIRKLTKANNYAVSTLAGSGVSGLDDKTNPLQATFANLRVMVVDGDGNVYVTDDYAYRIRKLTASAGYAVSTLAGSTLGFADNDDPLLAQFGGLVGIALDGDGNLYVTDTTNRRIRKLTASAGYAVTTLAGSGTQGYADNTDPLLAEFNSPGGVAVDGDGNVYVADYGNHRIRKLTASAGYAVSTVAGTGASGAVDGPASSAKFNGPYGMSMDSDGNLYVAEYGGSRIRKITLEE